MLFMNNRPDGMAVYELTDSSYVEKGKDHLVSYLGYPVEVYIVDDEENIIAEPHEMALWDVNDDTHGYRPISPREYNHLIEHWDGIVEILCVDVNPISSLPPMPMKVTGKVILRSPVEVDDESEEQFKEEEDM